MKVVIYYFLKVHSIIKILKHSGNPIVTVQIHFMRQIGLLLACQCQCEFPYLLSCSLESIQMK